MGAVLNAIRELFGGFAAEWQDTFADEIIATVLRQVLRLFVPGGESECHSGTIVLAHGGNNDDATPPTAPVLTPAILLDMLAQFSAGTLLKPLTFRL
jgi:hypothetical protein